MARNLDITTLRSFVAVADSGGVTRAAGFLHLTQSAVSMQIKRLEELLGLDLLDRSGRGIALTSEGDQLLSYARRMVALNDEVITRLTDHAYQGEISLGVPHDIVYPAIPRVMQQFRSAFPRVQIHLRTCNTADLKDQYRRGDCDVILTTEQDSDTGAERLCEMPLVWIGAPGGSAWRQRPLPLAQGRSCSFRPAALAALSEVGIDWSHAVDSDSDRTIEATVAADLAVQTMIAGTQPAQLEIIDHGGDLPPLPPQFINMYGARDQKNEVRDTLAGLLRACFEESRATLPMKCSALSAA